MSTHWDGKTLRNDITGESLRSRLANDQYRDGWDLIFGKRVKEPLAAPAALPEVSITHKSEFAHESTEN